MSAAIQTADVGRPKSDKPKNAAINFRTYPEVREAIESYARREHRTMAQMAELLLREAILSRRRKDKERAADIESLP